MSEFESKVVMIAGGARGIGRAIATSLAGAGAQIVLVDAPAPMQTLGYPLPDADALESAVAEIRAAGGTCTGYELDVRDRPRVAETVQRCIAEAGRIDMLVNCAGVGSVSDAGEMDDLTWSEVVDTNLNGFYNLVRAVTAHMTARGSGNIVAVVGDSARRGAAGLSHVSAAGWATIGLAKSLALETADAGVAVNVLSLGPVDTELSSSAEFRSAVADLRHVVHGQDAIEAMGRRHPNCEPWVPMEDVVRAARFLLGGGTSMTGSVLDVSAGLSALNSS
ncbi:SDR family NAD(P)-dependent oxidoreductase [Nocardioides marmoriginsengisoli]|uniref:SDR family NAD(P)-dependent oxidoreductase n=1 Tax=Nocardioides marmoriginsengisoli TaxID=661483 RepID=A0A3N0CHE1_9ACTN|nr:SDR family NAD(P)-dependent oxidoreductase [Nocardioides marmoriginsengisoli]RNL62446.1 SDR family NAD(P)-dependent oxidoreductase [Nocardioides marmoriginsengisoli]